MSRGSALVIPREVSEGLLLVALQTVRRIRQGAHDSAECAGFGRAHRVRRVRLRMSGEVSGLCLLAVAEQAAQEALVPFEAKTERDSSVRTASRARVAYADTVLSQARERLRYLLVKGAGPRLLGRAPRGPPLVMPAPPANESCWSPVRLGAVGPRLVRLEQVWAELRFALAQCAPRLPRDVCHIIMGYAKPQIVSEPVIRYRVMDNTDSGDEAHFRWVKLRVRPPARVAGA